MSELRCPTITLFDKKGEACICDPSERAARLAAGYTEKAADKPAGGKKGPAKSGDIKPDETPAAE